MKSRRGSDELRVSSSASTTRQKKNKREEGNREMVNGGRERGRLSEQACVVNLHSRNMQPRRREGDDWLMENGRQEEGKGKKEREGRGGVE